MALRTSFTQLTRTEALKLSLQTFLRARTADQRMSLVVGSVAGFMKQPEHNPIRTED